jgi:steroid 5-alpha reductase family enzyme
VLAVLTLSLGATYYLRQILVTAAVALWGIRLSGYLLYRVCTEGKDARFDNFERGFSLRFAAFWGVQAVWVLVGSLPVILLNGTDRDCPLSALDAIGWLIFVTGFVIETVADHEKFAFRSQPANKGRFCDVGLWGFSRHPNYFGGEQESGEESAARSRVCVVLCDCQSRWRIAGPVQSRCRSSIVER